MLEVEHVSKKFKDHQVLVDVNLKVNQGDVVVILGPSGSGKTTFLRCLNHLEKADTGRLTLGGKEYDLSKLSKKEILEIRQKTAFVFQHYNLFANKTALENILEGLVVARKIPKEEAIQRAESALEKVGLLAYKDYYPSQLSGGQQQRIGIARAIAVKPDVILLDEPTSALTEGETKKLFQVISNLKKKGITMVYISHRMEEIFEICDSYSVMRDGAYIAGGMIRDVTVDKLIEYMVGRSISQVFPGKHNVIGDIVLEARDISSGTEVRNVSFYLKQGEILGFAGLVGAGRTETLKAVFGADPKSKGQIMINGRTVPIHSPGDAIHRGIGFVPEDRKREGLVTELSVMDNVVMAKMDNSMNHGLFSIGKAKALCRYYIDSLMIKTPSEKQLAKYLSGGNQQKVVLAKWLNCAPDIIVLDEPTRGIDINAKMEIYNIIVKLAGEGKSIILVSSEMQEIIGLCDRVYVMCEGKVAGMLMKEELTQEKIMSYATGGR